MYYVKERHKKNFADIAAPLNLLFYLCGLVYLWVDSLDFLAYLDFNVALAELACVKDYRSTDVDSVVLLCDTVDEQSIALHAVVLVVRRDLLPVTQPVHDRRRIGLHFTLDLVLATEDRKLLFRRINPRNSICNR